MRGWDLHLRQVVAVRLLGQQEEPDLFVERAGALTDLAHPGLVRVLDAGVTHDGEPFVVQEFVAGTTLKARLAGGTLDAGAVTELGSALGRALAYAHSQGVAHRDVHPGNVLLGPGMEPCLTNVGTSPGTVVSYLAPEQVNGDDPTMASDVYSLGLVLLEALTGRTEYPGDGRTTALARLSRAPIIDPDLPHAAALRAMVCADPNDRPDAATCVDLLRGSSAKSRVQTRTVLIAAVAAAIAATGITIAMNLPKQPPQPRVAPQQATTDVTVTPPVITEVVDRPAGQVIDRPPAVAEGVREQPGILLPPITTTPTAGALLPWHPWEPLARPRLGKKPHQPWKFPPPHVGGEGNSGR
nr:serine/threonine-protein kinase [Kibdelosporangium phytohabitans]